VVICGYGRVGAELGGVLERRGFGFTVVEINPAVVRELRRQGIRAYYGDAGAEALLLRAGVPSARTLAVATPDLVAAEAAIRHARRLNPRIHIIARATAGGEVGALYEAGADEVVQPEFEAGLELVRQVLRWYGIAAKETQIMLAHRRAQFYQIDSPRPFAAEPEEA
jgi:CPA2 family monovalent cation:H+ antiporter-2